MNFPKTIVQGGSQKMSRKRPKTAKKDQNSAYSLAKKKTELGALFLRSVFFFDPKFHRFSQFFTSYGDVLGMKTLVLNLQTIRISLKQ